MWIINGMAVAAQALVIRELATLPEVDSVSIDARVTAPEVPPDRPRARAKASLAAATLGPPERNIDLIRAQDLWGLGYTGTAIVVATMDSVVDAAHQDLSGRWRGGSNTCSPVPLGLSRATARFPEQWVREGLRVVSVRALP